MSDHEQKIRERAYQLWLDAGQPEGQEDAHWRRASEEIGGADAGAGSTAGGSMQPEGTPESDAAGAFAPSQADSTNDGLDSAKPKVTTPDGDATRRSDEIRRD
jgi:hypothetical protein